jgi:hypothetical protein
MVSLRPAERQKLLMERYCCSTPMATATEDDVWMLPHAPMHLLGWQRPFAVGRGQSEETDKGIGQGYRQILSHLHSSK